MAWPLSWTGQEVGAFPEALHGHGALEVAASSAELDHRQHAAMFIASIRALLTMDLPQAASCVYGAERERACG